MPEGRVPPMRYALCLPIMGEVCNPRALAELAHIAEESGWDGVFIEDYVLHEDEQHQPEPSTIRGWR